MEEKENAIVYETITKAGEIAIADLESGEYYYTENYLFDTLARWDENERVSPADNMTWEYHFWFKRGDKIAEVYLFIHNGIH